MPPREKAEYETEADDFGEIPDVDTEEEGGPKENSSLPENEGVVGPYRQMFLSPHPPPPPPPPPPSAYSRYQHEEDLLHPVYTSVFSPPPPLPNADDFVTSQRQGPPPAVLQTMQNPPSVGWTEFGEGEGEGFFHAGAAAGRGGGEMASSKLRNCLPFCCTRFSVIPIVFFKEMLLHSVSYKL